MKKRFVSMLCVIAFLFVSICGRIAYIVFGNDYTVSESYNSYVLNLETLYPVIYYNNLEKLTDNKDKYAAVLRPNERTLTDLHNLFPSSQINEITNELKAGYPLVKYVDESKIGNEKYIKTFRMSDYECVQSQLISKASSGLLSYVEPCGKREMRFHIDALGRMLRGDEGEEYEESISNIKGIRLTLDKKVEEIAYNALSDMQNGCVVIMDVKTSSILACISKPDESYLNKAFSQYNVGSVFKIIVAACALENDIEFYYNCSGKTTVGDTEFSCQKNHNHGFENLSDALSNSCNCYFVNLAQKLGSKKLLATADKLGFNDDIKLYDEWSFKAANLPNKEELSSKGELSLFGFGQGKLTVSPLQMCYSLCTIGNMGVKNQVRLVYSSLDENANEGIVKYKASTRVLSEETSKALLEMLRNVVENGTGKSAEDSHHKSSGKTATAQTGRYILGTEILNTWFAGVYPSDNPKYAIVVMKENGKSGNEDCAPIYREIVEKLNYL